MAEWPPPQPGVKPPMASTNYFSGDDFGLEGLSERHLRILAAGVRGADGEAPAEGEKPAADATAEAPAPAPEGAAPEGEAPAEGTGAQLPTVLRDLPADVTSASHEDLQGIYDELGEARAALRENARTPSDVEAIREATARRNAIAQEFQRRSDESEKLTTDLEALDAELESEAALPAMAATASATPPRPTAEQIVAARGAQAPAAQDPPSPAPERPRAALVASMGGERVQAGDSLDLEELGELFDRSKKSRPKAYVASVPSYAEQGIGSEPLSPNNGAWRNTMLMVEAQEAHRARREGTADARVASICEPFDQIRTIPDGFTVAEPVTEAFPSRPIGRLGWTYIRSVELSYVDGATANWLEADQDAVDVTDSETWKPCIDIGCPTPIDAEAEAITACVRYDITTEMSSPEHVANVMNALGAARAREKEARVLERIDELSHHYNYAGDGYGAVPTLVAAINTALAQATLNNRIDPGRYVMILPAGVAELLAIDLAARAYETDVADALAYVKEKVVGGLSGVVRSLDWSAAGEVGLPFQALNPVGAAAVNLPSLNRLNAGKHRIRLVDPSGGLYGETGAINVGTQRGPAELRQNKTQYFAEEFIILEKNGPEPWFSLDVTLCADGSRAGLAEPAGCGS